MFPEVYTIMYYVLGKGHHTVYTHTYAHLDEV